MKRFNPKSNHPMRAVQAWQILVGKAMNRQTVTYEELSVLMYRKKAQGVLARILGHIAFYCRDNDLPLLVSIVVGKKRGTPGDRIPLSASVRDAEREQVYTRNWYDIVPPSERELESAWLNRRR